MEKVSFRDISEQLCRDRERCQNRERTGVPLAGSSRGVVDATGSRANFAAITARLCLKYHLIRSLPLPVLTRDYNAPNHDESDERADEAA